MKITLLHDSFDSDHLDLVIEEMKVSGRPTIKVYEIEEGWYQAIEGCHRLRAAEILNIKPKLEVLEQDQPFIVDDCAIVQWDGMEVETIGELGDVDNYSIYF